MATETDQKSAGGYFAIALSTAGVGFLPLAPGTWGSLVGVAIYVAASFLAGEYPAFPKPLCFAITAVLLSGFALVAFWSSKKAAEQMGGKDPQVIVIDEILGQLVTFVFIGFTMSWPLIVAGFVLFRVFDIWKPYPVRKFESLPDGIGICADDIVAGVYAGVVLSVVYSGYSLL